MHRFLEWHVSQYMTKNVKAIPPGMTLHELGALFDRHDFGLLIGGGAADAQIHSEHEHHDSDGGVKRINPARSARRDSWIPLQQFLATALAPIIVRCRNRSKLHCHDMACGY